MSSVVLVSDQQIGKGAFLGRAIEGPESRLADQQRAWEAVCVAAVELGADVINAGDVFERKKASPAELRAFQAGLDILREGGLQMIVCCGNHDVQTEELPTSVEAACAGYSVHVCRGAEVIETAIGPVGFIP